MGNTRNTGYLQNAIKVSDAGAISFMSGSTMLATINTTGQMSGSSPVLFASTASYADAFTVAGTLTAQTLVVQTITSSVDFVTGSTRFGSIAANTHTFTGSVLTSGSISIGTTSTTHRLNISTPSSSASGIQITKAGVLTSFLGDGGSEYPIGVLNLYDSGSQKVQIYAGSVSYFTGGNVGIRTTTPQASLHIAGLAEQNALTIGASNAFEIFITGSDSANIYHASPNQAIYLNTNGGALYLGPSAASTLLTITGSNVGIGTTDPTATLQVRGPNATGVFFDAQNAGAGGAVFSRINASSFPFNQYLFNNGNLGINTSSPETKLHVEGSTAIGTTGTENILLLGRAIGAGASFQQAASLKLGRYQNAGGSFESYTRLDFALRDNSAASNYNTNTTVMTLTNAGNVGIGVTNPQSILHISNGEIVLTETGFSTVRLHKISHGHSDGSNPNNFLGFQVSDGSGNTAERMRINGSGHLGVGTTNPLGTLSTYGGAVQIMGDYRNHQTIIKSSGTAGTYSGQLTITIPEMAGAGVSQGFGGYSCEVYVAGFQGLYCHAWFSGYINNGLVVSEATILRSSGGWSISQTVNGTYSQGFIFYVDYPASIVHPTARIIFNKGGDPNTAEYPANQITATWS